VCLIELSLKLLLNSYTEDGHLDHEEPMMYSSAGNGDQEVAS
jgi:hypothetical protein